jgi:limonene-1,2-epoxide hydrolase
MAPIDVVEAFLNAYFGADAEATIRLVTDDFEWISMCAPDRATRGRDAMHQKVFEQNFGFPAPFRDGHHVTVRALCDGGTVMHERIDFFTMNDTVIEVPCAATFLVREGAVAMWHDYFDMGTVIRQMAAAGVQLGTGGH